MDSTMHCRECQRLLREFEYALSHHAMLCRMSPDTDEALQRVASAMIASVAKITRVRTALLDHETTHE